MHRKFHHVFLFLRHFQRNRVRVLCVMVDSKILLVPHIKLSAAVSNIACLIWSTTEHIHWESGSEGSIRPTFNTLCNVIGESGGNDRFRSIIQCEVSHRDILVPNIPCLGHFPVLKPSPSLANNMKNNYEKTRRKNVHAGSG